MKLGTKVVVSTNKDSRGVFFGTLAEQSGDAVTLVDARMIVYWSKETKGFTGLAAIGPQAGSRVGPPAPVAELVGVTCVMQASDVAIAQWESNIWGN